MTLSLDVSKHFASYPHSGKYPPRIGSRIERLIAEKLMEEILVRDGYKPELISRSLLNWKLSNEPIPSRILDILDAPKPKHSNGSSFAVQFKKLISHYKIILMTVWTIAGAGTCSSTLQNSPASVRVETSWGHYYRRPPGGKIADDKANAATLWMRLIIFTVWASPFGVYLYAKSRAGRANKTLQLTPSRDASFSHDRLSFPSTSLQSLCARSG